MVGVGKGVEAEYSRTRGGGADFFVQKVQEGVKPAGLQAGDHDTRGEEAPVHRISSPPAAPSAASSPVSG